MATDDGTLTDARLTTVGLFLEAHAGLIARLAEVHARHGLRGSDFDALLRLARSPGCRLRMSDLATQTGMSTSGVTRLVDRLVDAGLVERHLSGDDRRAWLVTLTDTGRHRLHADAVELADTIDDVFVAPLGQGRIDDFAADLRRLRDHLHPGATEGA